MSPYTTAEEILKRAPVKWDSLNYQPGVPFADETALKTWLTEVITPQVEAIINNACRRPDFLRHTDEVEHFNGDGFRDFVSLSKKPVIAVGKFEIRKEDGTWDLKSAANYFLRGDLVRYHRILPQGFQNIRLTYDWGYEGIPEDVQHVAAEMSARFLQKRVAYKMEPLVRVGDYRTELVNPEVFTSDLRGFLEHYRLEAAAIV